MGKQQEKTESPSIDPNGRPSSPFVPGPIPIALQYDLCIVLPRTGDRIVLRKAKEPHEMLREWMFETDLAGAILEYGGNRYPIADHSKRLYEVETYFVNEKEIALTYRLVERADPILLLRYRFRG